MTYSQIRKEQIELETEKRKKILDKCEEASKKIDNGDRGAVEELFQALQEYNALRGN